MAGDWIKLEDLRRDPKVRAVGRRLGADTFSVIGRITSLWLDADQQADEAEGDDALLPHLVPEDLDEEFGEGFAAAIESVGWLRTDERGLILPGFFAKNGATAKKRALTARRVAAHKAGKRSGNAEVTQGALPREREEKKDVEDTREAKAEADPEPPAETLAECLEEGLRERGVNVDPEPPADSPPSSGSGAGGGSGALSEIDMQVHRLIRESDLLAGQVGPKQFSNLRRLLEVAGSESAAATTLRYAIAHGARDPTSYAVKCALDESHDRRPPPEAKPAKPNAPRKPRKPQKHHA